MLRKHLGAMGLLVLVVTACSTAIATEPEPPTTVVDGVTLIAPLVIEGSAAQSAPPIYCLDGTDAARGCVPWPTHCLNGLRFAPPTLMAPAGSCLAGTTGARPVGYGVWDRIAQCESGGNWSIRTGNGYYGGLQMDMQFWRTYGGGVAARPDLASREQQIAAATRARDSGRGYRPWPACSRKLGLR